MEKFFAKLDSADFDGDFCIQKFNERYRSVRYDEDGTHLFKSEYFDTALEAFAALDTQEVDDGNEVLRQN